MRLYEHSRRYLMQSYGGQLLKWYLLIKSGVIQGGIVWYLLIILVINVDGVKSLITEGSKFKFKMNIL